MRQKLVLQGEGGSGELDLPRDGAMLYDTDSCRARRVQPIRAIFFFGVAAAQKKGPARRFSEQPQHSQFVGPVTPRRGRRDRSAGQGPFKYFTVRQPRQATDEPRKAR